jgi:GT2 family glycosyltransferase
MLDISIIILNYKSWEHLDNCLHSIENICTTHFSFEIIVVDNKSDDGILSSFQTKFQKVNFIENTGNNGFANGCNLGAKNAKGSFYLFLNPDTLISETPIQLMLHLAKKHLDYGIISCETVNKTGKIENQVRFLPRFSTLFGSFRAIYKWVNQQKIKSEYNISKEVIFPEWVSGSLIFISKNWFEKIGGWNEDYWMYFEDVAICKQISEKGGKIALMRGASIVHNHGGASRLNIKTAIITKTEVLISKHVYINNNFKGFSKYISQIFVIVYNLISYFILAILGVIFFSIPKLKLNVYLFKNLVNYYFKVLKSGFWLSERSMNLNFK